MKNALIIFTRVPLPGKTKTRLMTHFTGEECAAIHICFLKDIYEMVQGLDAEIFVYYTPGSHRDNIKGILRGCKNFYSQRGQDLGERMYEAIDDCIQKGYEKTLLIGTDLPTLPAHIIKEAYEKLENHDVVLGPTLDGGYYLIGMKAAHQEIFKNNFYGLPSVFERTLANIHQLELKVAIVEKWYDVDTFEDLKHVINEIESKGMTAYYTGQFLFCKGLLKVNHEGEERDYGKMVEGILGKRQSP